MTNSMATNRPAILTRYKVYEERHHLNRKVYRNKGVLKDAERFSLVDTVLDGEYNDFEIAERISPPSTRFMEFRKKTSKSLANFGRTLSGGIFRILLTTRLAVYYLLHTLYRAR